MHVLFVHGWSVADTETYGHLPRWLAQQAGPDGRTLAVGDIYLGQYISFDDTITLDDIARAFEEQLTYPGEIKVTVVRESRFTDVAR